MESLPSEVLANILSRLPITTIVLATLVCKTWRNIVRDPLLLRLHFSHEVFHNFFLILHRNYRIQSRLHTLEFSPGNENIEGVKEIHVPMIPVFDVVGYVNGLLCICDSLCKNSIYIYNPSSKDCKEAHKYDESPTDQEVELGFGFDSKTNEYKIIRIEKGHRGLIPRRQFSLQQSEAQVLSISSDKSWRSLGQFYDIFIKASSQVLVNGRLHWVTWPTRHAVGRRIISFDFTEESFQEVPTPQCGRLNRCCFNLAVLGSHLSAAIFEDNGGLEIWVMREYDAKDSWMKDFKIGAYIPRGLEKDLNLSLTVSQLNLTSSSVRVLCVLSNGEILLEYRCKTIVSYDPLRGVFGISPIQNCQIGLKLFMLVSLIVLALSSTCTRVEKWLVIQVI